VFLNRLLRRIFGPQREKVAAGWKRLHNEELYNLYTSTNMIIVIKSRKIRSAGHVARMGEIINAYNILVVKLEGKGHPGELGIVWRIILGRILGD
jgi:hypothetical protein